MRESSLPILEAVTDLICRFNINGTYYVYTDARHSERTQDANVRSQDNHYVVFCPPYYELQTLYKTLSITDAFPPERLLVTSANDFDESQGEVYFHESLVCGGA